MAKKKRKPVVHQKLTLDGMHYVILRESEFKRLCVAAAMEPAVTPEEEGSLLSPGLQMDRESLAKRLIRRRQAAGLSQAELARRAGIRPETLNRIERGHTTPDFATVRKLVEAINATEME